ASVEPVEELGEDGEEERLAAIKATLDQRALEYIKEEVAHLRELQETPDPPEALATLPLLTLDDIAQAPVEPSWEFNDATPLPCIYHDIPTRGIDYIYTYYSLEGIPFEDLPYVTVLAMLLGKLDTAQHTAEELDKLTQANLGSLRFFSDLYTNDADTSLVTPRFVIATSSLSEDIDYAIDLPIEIRDTTRFADKDAIRDILTQRRIGMEQYFASSGNSAALSRCSSYVSATACGREQMGGVDFYRFLKDTLAQFDTVIDTVIAKLEEVARVIFTATDAMVSFTGPREDLDRFWNNAGTLGLVSADAPKRFSLPEPQVKNEAFIVPADVCFAAKGFDARLEHIAYDGSWSVAAKALSYDYLWNEVRVKGGAYGAGFRSLRTGSMQFYSYRDPNLDETIARFDNSAAWLSAFDPEETEMRGYIISSVASLDAPSKPREVARRQDGDWFCKRPEAYRETLREQLLATTPEKLRAHGNELAQIVAHDVRCAFGSRSIIEGSNAQYDVVDLLN
ncbi:MAG: peptidase M16, partial [Raoultibacter sp.]